MYGKNAIEQYDMEYVLDGKQDSAYTQKKYKVRLKYHLADSTN